jgi:phytoene dehydrogenase-like protein
MEHFDYIVIGAGHNGLCAGATLAEAGRSVCVVERLPITGGLSASHPYVGDAPEHLLSLGAMDDMFMAQTSLARDMRLADHGYRTVPLAHPYGWMNEDGDTLLLWHDFERTLADIRYFSPADARTYAALRGPMDWIMDLVDALVPQHPAAWGKTDFLKYLVRHRPNRATLRLIQQMLSTNVFEMISETFESDAMRGLWAYWSSMVGPADAQSAGAYLLGFAGVHRHGGVLRPQGGMTNLMTAFQGVLEQHGGEVRLGVGVEQVVVEGGRATGVLLEDGSRLNAARGVLSGAAPQVTLGKLVPQQFLSREDQNKVALIPCNSVNAAAFKIDVATAGRAGYPAAEAARAKRDGEDIRTTTFMTGTLEDHIEQMHAMKSGLNVTVPPVYMAILSAPDRSIASDEGDVVYLHSNVPAHPNDGWEANKAAYTEQIWSSVGRFMGGLDTEIGRMVNCPQDFEDRFAAPRGAYFHVDMLPSRLGMNRPARGLGGYETPIRALYQSGAGTHPSGGVTGWNGRLAAQHAMKLEAA